MKNRFWIIPATALLCAAIINILFIINAHVPSASMEPTIKGGSFVIGDKNAYSESSPKTGDIIFFKKEDVSDALLIKRIIATPGQRFSMVDGRVYVDDVMLDEPYIENFSDDDFNEVTVPDDSYIVLGDNRVESSDSRVWDDPFVEKDQIKAKANLVWFPEIKKLDTE